MTQSPSARPQELPAAKRDLRPVMEERRALAHANNPHADQQLRNIVREHFIFPPHSLIASYNSFGTEMSPHLLAESLWEQGHTILLPAVVRQHAPLEFRVHTPGAPLVKGWRGILEPSPTAPVASPTILLVPMLAFDSNLYRLGYGGGYYDRTLTRLRAQGAICAVGIAFDCQRIQPLPTQPHDAKLDCIATESNWYS